MATDSPTHDHIEFRTESIASVRACTGCGAMIPSGLTDEHQAFHDRLRAAETAASASSKPKKPKKK